MHATDTLIARVRDGVLVRNVSGHLFYCIRVPVATDLAIAITEEVWRVGVHAAEEEGVEDMRGEKQIAKCNEWRLYRDKLGEVRFETHGLAVIYHKGECDVWLPDAAVEALVADVAARDHQVTELLEAGDE